MPSKQGYERYLNDVTKKPKEIKHAIEEDLYYLERINYSDRQIPALKGKNVGDTVLVVLEAQVEEVRKSRGKRDTKYGMTVRKAGLLPKNSKKTKK